MSLRFNALNRLSQTSAEQVEGTTKITAIFGENVFDLKKARQYLSDEAYKSLLGSIRAGQKIQRNVANQIANGMRAWAESKGVTHYTHWFQPLRSLPSRAMAPRLKNLKAMPSYSRSPMHPHFQAAASAPLLKRAAIQPGTPPLLPLLCISARAKHFAFRPFSFLIPASRSITKRHC
jgi:hypothetical protein